MDKRHIVAALFERTGIRLDEDDPALVLVELNHIMLQRAVEKSASRIEEAAQKFSDTAANQSGDFVVLANETLAKFMARTEEIKELLAAAPQQTAFFPPQFFNAARQQQAVAWPPPQPDNSIKPSFWVPVGAFLVGTAIGLVFNAVLRLF
jgi:hypothetical protein